MANIRWFASFIFSVIVLSNPALAVNIFSEGFEGGFPGSWTVGDSDTGAGEDYWDDTSVKASAGSWSAWAADIGDNSVDGGTNIGANKYDIYMGAFMWKTVSLGGYSSVTLSYKYWVISESGYDKLQVMYESGGSWSYADTHSGNSAGWQSSSVLIPTSATKVGFYFYSDYSEVDQGAYIDEVSLDGIPPACSAPGIPADAGTRCQSVGADRISFGWNTVSGASNYKLQYKKSSDSSYSNIDTAGTGTLQQVIGLSASTQYDFQVQVRTSDGTCTAPSAWSATGSCTTTAPPDTTPPTRSSGAPSGTVTGSTQTLSLTTTNEAATCRYSTTANTAYDSMTSTFSTTSGTSHSQALSGLTSGSKSYYVRCKDSANNPNTDDYTISFTVNLAPSSSISFDKTTPLMLQGITLSITATDDRGVREIQFYDGSTLLNSQVCAGYPTSCTKTFAVTAPASAVTKTYKGYVYDSDLEGVWSSPNPLSVNFVDSCADWACPALSAGDRTTGLPTISSTQYVNYVDCTTTCTCPAGYNIEVTATGTTEANRDYFSLVGDCAGRYGAASGTFNNLYNACGTRSAGLRFTSDYSAYGSGSISATRISCVVSDTTPPTITASSPSGVVSNPVTMAVTTNEVSDCKYSATAGTAYGSMTGTFTTTDGLSHSASLGTLTTGAKNYYVRCQDRSASQNKMAGDYTIPFTVNLAPLISSFTPNKNSPIALGNSIILTTTATDDTGVAKIYFYDPDNTNTDGDIPTWHMQTCSGSPTSCTKTWTATPAAGDKTYLTIATDTNGAQVSDIKPMTIVNSCADWACPSLSAGDKTTGLPSISQAQYVNYVDCQTTCACPAGYKIEITASGHTESGNDKFSLIGDCANKYNDASGTFGPLLYKDCGTQSAGLKFISDHSLYGASGYGYTGVSVSKVSCVISDTTSPTLSNVAPSGTVTGSSQTLSLTTNEAATCKYSTTTTAYGSMTQFTTTGLTLHSQALSGLTGGAKTYYVGCRDAADNEGSATASFTVNLAPSVSSFTLDKTSPIALGKSVILTTTATDDTGVAKIYFYDPDNTNTAGDPETTDIPNWHMQTCSGSPTSCTKTWTATPTVGDKGYLTIAKDGNDAMASDTKSMTIVNSCANWVYPSPSISNAQYVNNVDCSMKDASGNVAVYDCGAGNKLRITHQGTTEGSAYYHPDYANICGNLFSGAWSSTVTDCNAQTGSVLFHSDYSSHDYAGATITGTSCYLTDNTAPTVTLTLPGGTSAETFDIAWTVSDVASGPQTVGIYQSDSVCTTNNGCIDGGSCSTGSTCWDAGGAASADGKTHYGKLRFSGTIGNSYYFKAYGIDVAGNVGTLSPATSTKVVGLPSLPSPSNTGTITTLTPTLSWTGATGAGSYALQLCTDASCTSRVLDPDVCVTGTSYVIASGLLTWQNSYTWKLWPSASSDCSSYRLPAVWTFNTMMPAPANLAPTDGSSVPITPTLQWDPVSGANCYQVNVIKSSDSSTVIAGDNTGSNSYTITSGLVQGVEYKWQVKASPSSCGTSGMTFGQWSSQPRFTTGAACSDINNPCDIPLAYVSTNGGNKVYNGGTCQNQPQSCVKSLVTTNGDWGYWKFTLPAQSAPDKPSYQTNIIGWRENTGLTGSVKIGTTKGGNEICDWFPICTTNEIVCQGTNCYKGLDPGKTYYATIGGVSGSALGWVGIAATENSCGVSTPFTDTVTVGGCSVTLTHMGFDYSDKDKTGDLGAVRYKNNGQLTSVDRQIEFDDATSGGCDMDLKFTNVWDAGVMNPNTLRMNTINVDKDAGNYLMHGYSLQTSNCKFDNDFKVVSLADSADLPSVNLNPSDSGAGSGARQYCDSGSMTNFMCHLPSNTQYIKILQGGDEGASQSLVVDFPVYECLPDENTNAAGYNNFCALKNSGAPYCDTNLKKCYGCSVANNEPSGSGNPNMNDCGVGGDGITIGKCDLASSAAFGGSCRFLTSCDFNTDCSTACCSAVAQTSGPERRTPQSLGNKCITPGSPNNPLSSLISPINSYLCKSV